MTQTATLHTSGKQPDAFFDSSVSISGDTIAVCAPLATNRYPQSRGAVYVFVKPAGGWKDMSETAKLNVFGAYVAFPVAINKDMIAVAGPTNTGPVYLFVRPSAGWQRKSRPTATLQPDQFAGFFGYSIAIASDTIAVGAPGSFSGTGAVYLFVKPAGGWRGNVSQTARLVGSDGLEDFIGESVATDGNNVFAGAPSTNQIRGAVYVYVKPSGGWSNMTETAVLSAADTVDLGWSMSLSGNTVVAGAPYATVGANPEQGAAFVFVKPADGWKTTSKANAKLVADDGAVNDHFGASVAISGNTVVVGSPEAAIGSNLNQGAAYMFGR